MQVAKPTFKNEHLEYFRQEKDGYWTFLSKRHPEVRELLVNATGKQVLDLCDGTRTEEDIVKAMKDLYPEAPLDLITKDVSKILTNYSRVAIVTWDGENPYLFKREQYLDDDYFGRIGTEEDIEVIMQFAKEEQDGKVHFASPFCKDFDFDEIVLRQRIFNYNEEFFFLEKDNKIEGMISVALPVGNESHAGRIKTINCPKEQLGTLLKYTLDTLPYIGVVKLTKIKVDEDMTNQMDPEILAVLTEEGFFEEVVMKEELGFGRDLREWTWVYEKEYVEKIEKSRRNRV